MLSLVLPLPHAFSANILRKAFARDTVKTELMNKHN
jgi:hypothetical protein